MAIKITHGDLLKEQVDAIVNTVNCVGIMGKGIALQFKQKWPENFRQYDKACKAGEVRPGKMLMYDLGALASKPHYIINFPTKDHWRGKSKLSFIEDGLADLIGIVKQHNIRSIAMPPLGCGNGGLNWAEVRQLIERAFAVLPEVEIHLYEPKGAPDAQAMIVHTEKPRMTAGRAILIKLISIYRETGYLLSKIEIQKLCYFAYVLGAMNKLAFEKNQYGPYANNLRHVLNDINGHYIAGVGDHDTAEAQISLLEGAVSEADSFLKDYPDSIAALERISKLIEGFETPYGMELLATVHWGATKDVEQPRLDNVINAIYNWEPSNPAWGARKKALMQEAHIRIAMERLQSTGWI